MATALASGAGLLALQPTLLVGGRLNEKCTPRAQNGSALVRLRRWGTPEDPRDRNAFLPRRDDSPKLQSQSRIGHFKSKQPILGAPNSDTASERKFRLYARNTEVEPIQSESSSSPDIIALRVLGLGFLAYYGLNVVPKFLPFLEAALKSPTQLTGIVPLDLIPGVLGPFYQQICSTPSGLIAFGMLSTVSIAWGLLAGSEASRLGAKGFWLTQLTINLLMINFLAVATVVPAIWTPAYFLSPTQDSLPQKERVVAPKRTALIAAQNWITTAFLIGIGGFTSSRNQDWAVLLFTLSPLYLPLMWQFVKTTPETDEDKSRQAIVGMHLMQAGISIAWHVQALTIMVNNPGTLNKILSLAGDHSGSLADGFAFFIFADALLLILVLAYFAVRQSGVKVAAPLAAATFLVGPAASLGLYFAYRELEKGDAL